MAVSIEPDWNSVREAAVLRKVPIVEAVWQSVSEIANERRYECPVVAESRIGRAFWAFRIIENVYDHFVSTSNEGNGTISPISV